MIERKIEAIKEWLENPVTKDLIKFLEYQYSRYDDAIREGNYYRAGDPHATQENLVALMERRGEVENILQYFDVEQILELEETDSE